MKSNIKNVAVVGTGVIGTGWTGGIRANACATSPLINELHIAEINPTRLAEVKQETNPVFSTTDWEELLKKDELEAIVISATPESTHYPMIKAALEAGKHVFVEKPLCVNEAELVQIIEAYKRTKNLSVLFVAITGDFPLLLCAFNRIIPVVSPLL